MIAIAKNAVSIQGRAVVSALAIAATMKLAPIAE
jgi:hypothetical protein